jgi:hypothetical protein
VSGVGGSGEAFFFAPHALSKYVKGVRGEKECPGEGRRGRAAGDGVLPGGVAKERQFLV